MGDGLPKVQRMGTGPFHSTKVSALKKLSRQGPECMYEGTDHSDRDHITVGDCFWIARLVMKHSLSV